jgi:hypothetical protein
LFEDRLPLLAFGELDRSLVELLGCQFFAGFKLGNPAIEGAGGAVGEAHDLDGRDDVRQAVFFQIVTVRHYVFLDGIPLNAPAQGIMLWSMSMCNKRLRERYGR